MTFEIRINRKKEKDTNKKKRGGGGSNLGNGRFPFPNIPGDEWENRSARGKNPLVGRRENPTDINFDERACHQSSGKQNHIKKRKEKKGENSNPKTLFYKDCS